MYKVKDVVKIASTNAGKLPDGRWASSRPCIPPFAVRLKDALSVLRGKADAVDWSVD